MAYLFKLSNRLIVERHLPTIASDAYGCMVGVLMSVVEITVRVKKRRPRIFKTITSVHLQMTDRYMTLCF
jgi:hypothetical protein